MRAFFKYMSYELIPGSDEKTHLQESTSRDLESQEISPDKVFLLVDSFIFLEVIFIRNPPT